MEESREAAALKIAEGLVRGAFPLIEVEELAQMGGGSRKREVLGTFWTGVDRSNEASVKARLHEMADLIAELKRRLLTEG